MATHSDLYYNTGISSLLVPANRTAAANSTGLDLQNFESAVIGFNIGAPGDTWSGSTRIELQIQESDDNSTFTACADSALTNPATGGVATGTVAILNANAQGSAVYFNGYIGFKRYIRGVVSYVGTHTNGTPSDVFGLAGRPRQGKVNP